MDQGGSSPSVEKRGPTPPVIGEWIQVPVSKLVKAPWNYKRTDDEESLSMRRTLRAGIEKHGQLETMLVREMPDGTFEVANGNHRLDVFLELGTETVMVHSLGRCSEAKAKRCAYALNETRFKPDPFLRAHFIHDLLSDTPVEDFTDLPHTVSELTNFSALLSFPWEEAETLKAKKKKQVEEGEKAKIEVPAPVAKLVASIAAALGVDHFTFWMAVMETVTVHRQLVIDALAECGPHENMLAPTESQSQPAEA